MATQFLTGEATNPTPAPVQAPSTPTVAAPMAPASSSSAVSAPTPPGLDSTVLNLAKAIRQQESGGNYTASGVDGEHGAYQFTPATWNATAPKYGITTPLEQATPEEQNATAYNYILDLKNQGYNPIQVASIWNSGNPDPNHAGQGTSKGGAAYNTPAYATNVYNYYNQFKQQETDAAGVALQTSTLPSYNATFQSSPDDNLLVAGLKTLGNIPSSIFGVGQGIFNTVAHPIDTLKNVGSAAIGGAENLTGSNPGNPDQYQQQANALGHAILQRYGSLDALKNTMTNDPAGFALDIGTLVTGGEGLAAKGATLADIVAGTDKAAMAAKGFSEAGTTGLNVMPKAGAMEGVVRNASSALNQGALSLAKTIISPVTGLGSKLADATLGGAKQDVFDASNRTGIQLPAGSYTDSSLIRSAQALGATGSGEEATVAKINAAAEQIRQVAEKLVTSAGGEADISAAGESIAASVKAFSKSVKSAYQAGWKPIEAAIGSETPLTTEASVNKLKGLISDYNARGLSSDARYFQTKLQALLGKTGEGNLTVSTLKAIREDIDKDINYKGLPVQGVPSTKADLLGLRSTLEGDLQKSIGGLGGQAMLDGYGNLQTAFATGYKALGNKYITAIQKAAKDGNFSTIINAAIKPAMPIEDIPKIMQVLGGEGSEGVANLRSGFMSKILDEAKDVEDNFTPKGITKQLNKYGDKVNAILTPEQVQGLHDLGTLTQAIADSQKLAQGATTGFLVRTALQFRQLGETGGVLFALGDFASGNLIGAAQKLGTVFGVEATSKFFASNVGQRMLKWAAAHGTDFIKEAKQEGLQLDPVSGMIPKHEYNQLNSDGATANTGVLNASGVADVGNGLLAAGGGNRSTLSKVKTKIKENPVPSAGIANEAGKVNQSQ